MGEDTEISWADHTFNPWIGCTKIDAACKNCYAAAWDSRNMLGDGSHWGDAAPRRFFEDKHWNLPLRWNRRAEARATRATVFCASLADVFEDRYDLIPHRLRLWNLIRETRWLDWLLLTKRISNARRMLPWMNTAGRQIDHAWPNVWLGVTAAHNEAVELHVPELRSIPAAVHYVSCEPVLEHIATEVWDLAFGFREELARVDWMIIGDESGRGARPAQIAWIREACDAAQRHNIAFHFKQWAGREIPAGIERRDEDRYDDHGELKRGKIHLPVLDGTSWAEFPRQR